MTTFATCGRSQPSSAALPTRSPDTATAEDLRRFQLHQTQTGMQPPSINGAVAALRFFFTVTLDRPDLARRLTIVREPRRLPAVLSVAEVTLLLQAAPGPKYKAALATARACPRESGGRGGAGLVCRPRGRSAAGRLLPPGLHAASRERPNRLPEQVGGLRSAVPHVVRDIAHHRRRSKASRRAHRHHRRAPYLGLGYDPSSACAYDRARRRNIARWYALGALQTRFPLTGARAVPPVPAALPDAARRRARGGPAGVFRRARRPAWPRGLRRVPRAAQEKELVRLRQAALRRARSGARLSRPLHPPRRHREQPPGRPRRARHNLPLQGLPQQRP